ncbi:MAG: hypothetical protein J5940_07075 [Clostridia bacterium]|nr:hypothetical protein [Clostridia bacterium]
MIIYAMPIQRQQVETGLSGCKSASHPAEEIIFIDIIFPHALWQCGIFLVGIIIPEGGKQNAQQKGS